MSAPTAFATVPLCLSTFLGPLRQCNPDVIICDIGLPDEDVISFIKEIRNQPDVYPKSLAIAVTGFTAAKHQQLAIDAGFKAFFNRPVALHQIIDCIQRTLQTGDSSQPER